MTAKTLQDAGASNKSKYRDFKIYLDNQMGGNPLQPVDAGDQNLFTVVGGSWPYSTLISEDPDAVSGNQPGDPDGFSLSIVGPHIGSDPLWTRIGLIQSWFNSRPTPQSDDPLDFPDISDPLMNLFDDGDAMNARLTNIQNEGDEMPYDEDSAFGNAATTGGSNNLMRVSVAQPTSNTQLVAPVHGFQALCGLVQVVVGSGSTAANEWELVLDVETKGESF